MCQLLPLPTFCSNQKTTMTPAMATPALAAGRGTVSGTKSAALSTRPLAVLMAPAAPVDGQAMWVGQGDRGWWCN